MVTAAGGTELAGAEVGWPSVVDSALDATPEPGIGIAAHIGALGDRSVTTAAPQSPGPTVLVVTLKYCSGARKNSGLSAFDATASMGKV